MKKPFYCRLIDHHLPEHSHLEGKVFFRWIKKFTKPDVSHVPDIDLYVLTTQQGDIPDQLNEIYDKKLTLKVPFQTWTFEELQKLGTIAEVTPVADMIPAHPLTHDPEDGQTEGMTLLDHIAISCFTACLPGSTRDVEELAEDAYQYAHLLMKERKKYIYTRYMDD